MVLRRGGDWWDGIGEGEGVGWKKGLGDGNGERRRYFDGCLGHGAVESQHCLEVLRRGDFEEGYADYAAWHFEGWWWVWWLILKLDGC